MAIIHCANCTRRYSSLRDTCPHCGADQVRATRESKRKRAGAGPNTHYLIAMLAAIGGAGWYYSAVAKGDDPGAAKWLIGIGILWYAFARAWGFLRRK